MICHYWYFKDSYKYQPYVCKKCHDLSLVIDYNVSNFTFLNIKSVDYRCYMFNMSKKDAITLLKNSVLDNKGVL